MSMLCGPLVGIIVQPPQESAATTMLIFLILAHRGFVPDRVKSPALAVPSNSLAFQTDSGQCFMAIAERETKPCCLSATPSLDRIY